MMEEEMDTGGGEMNTIASIRPVIQQLHSMPIGGEEMETSLKDNRVDAPHPSATGG